MRDILTRKLVSSRLKWAGHVEKMEGERERSTKRAHALKVEDRRRKGRPTLRWEDCVKRDLAGVGESVENESEGWGKTVGGDGEKSEKKSTIGVGDNLSPDSRDKEESNNCETRA